MSPAAAYFLTSSLPQLPLADVLPSGTSFRRSFPLPFGVRRPVIPVSSCSLLSCNLFAGVSPQLAKHLSFRCVHTLSSLSHINPIARVDRLIRIWHPPHLAEIFLISCAFLLLPSTSSRWQRKCSQSKLDKPALTLCCLPPFVTLYKRAHDKRHFRYRVCTLAQCQHACLVILVIVNRGFAGNFHLRLAR